MTPFDADALRRLELLLVERCADELERPDLRRACVVIPLMHRDGRWVVIFQRRSEGLRVHKGQIAFPGGGAEEGESLEEAAVRETEEEIGVRREHVRLVGRLDDVITRTGFIVAPFVGVLDFSYDYAFAEDEVVEVFEVPVDALLDEQNPEVRYLDYRGEKFPVYFYHYDGREIWGLTGRILKAFLDLVRLSV